MTPQKNNQTDDGQTGRKRVIRKTNLTCGSGKLKVLNGFECSSVLQTVLPSIQLKISIIKGDHRKIDATE